MELQANPAVTRVLASESTPSDRTADDLAIFSAPGVGVVMHWWAESNRRWAERDQSKRGHSSPASRNNL
jgi:hypothetical protein